MNIAIDIDDTLTDSFSYFQSFVAEYFNVDIEYPKRENISYSNFPSMWKDRELAFCKKYYDSKAEDTPFKPYAAESVKKLKNNGHKIFIITARTKEFYTDPYKITTAELKKGGIIYDKLICTFDKAKVCAEEDIDLLIDDMPNNCDSAAQLGIKALMFESSANAKIKTPHTKVSNWANVLKIISEM